MATPLNYDSLPGFDDAPGTGDDLSGFDTASGDAFVPAGKYICLLEKGELTTTGKGKNAYRLRFKIVAPAEHAGRTLWRWLILDADGMHRAKTALAPLGLTSSAKLQEEYPPFGEDVYCQCLVTVKTTEQYGTTNDVQRFTPCPAPVSATVANPFAVDLSETKEGSKS